MNDQKLELIAFRLSRADESFDMAELAVSKNYLSTAVSELYYTCFYLVTALFARYDIKASTHSGVKSVLGSHLIKEGIIDPHWGKLVSKLFLMRQQGDYGDFKIFTETEVKPLLSEVREFMRIAKEIIAK